MNDSKLTRWIERIKRVPENADYEEFLDLLIESRIIEEIAS